MFSNHVNINILGSTVNETEPAVNENNPIAINTIGTEGVIQKFEGNSISPLSVEEEEENQLINYKNQQIL